MNIIIFIILSIILGFIFGSFLDVVSVRMNTGRSLNGRSICFSCSKKLKWYELIPVFSWLLQRGRCNKCSSHISPEIIVSEIITGIFFGIIAARGLFVNGLIFNYQYIISTIYLFAIVSILVIILFYDLRHKIIPNKLVFIFIILSFISIFLFSFVGDIFNFIGINKNANIWNILAGIIVPLPFAIIWVISRGRLIGLGDPKLMVGIGFLLGISSGFSAVFISFWIGALFSISIFIINKIFQKDLFLKSKNSIIKAEVPFAPFLILGTLITLIFNINVLPL